MLPLFNELRLESIPGSIQAECLKIDIKPVERNEKGTETKLPMDMIAVNNPSEVLVLLPADLKDGTYELRLTTQYCHSSQTMLKTPRTVSRFINIGASQGSGDDDIVDDPTA